MSTLAAELPKEMTSLQFRPLFIFRIAVNKPSVIGQTPSVDRRVGEITGGVFEGERLSGKILSGGSDWQVVRRDGSWVLDVRFVMETDDQHLIGMTYKGIRHGPQAVLDRIARGESVNPGGLLFPRGAVLRDGFRKIRLAQQCGGGGDRPPAGERADLPGVRGAVAPAAGGCGG